MTSSAPTQVHHTVGNDLGGTQRPSGELGWGGLAFHGAASSRRETESFKKLTRLMGEAEMYIAIAGEEVGGPQPSERNPSSVIDQTQRTGTTWKRVGGLETTSDPVFSRNVGNVVFIDQREPGGSSCSSAV